MVKELIRGIRTCSKAERRDFTRILIRHARAGSDAAFSELRRMAEGGGRTLLARYSPEDQLAGIEALGRTGRKDALLLLRSWRKYREVYAESCTGLACGSDHMPQWTALVYEFHRAPRRLSEKLRYTGPKSSPAEHPVSLTPAEHAEHQAQNPYHIAVSLSISRLEKTIGR